MGPGAKGFETWVKEWSLAQDIEDHCYTNLDFGLTHTCKNPTLRVHVPNS